MKKTSRRILWTFLLSALVILLSVPQYLYFSGLWDVPADRDPLVHSSIPKQVAQSYWRYLEGAGQPVTSPKNPYGFLMDFFSEIGNMRSRYRTSAEYALLTEAARSLMGREDFRATNGDWHLSSVAALIWISRNWSADESISTVLLDSYFGHGFRGIEGAARGYFGISLDRISGVQTVYLLVIRLAPSRFNPWCNPEAHRKVFQINAERIGYDIEYDSIEIRPVPAGACE